MSGSLAPGALKSLREAYSRVVAPRVFLLAAGKHWGRRAAKLNAEQLAQAFNVVHEQYQRGYRGVRLRRNAAMRMGAFCNTNSMVFLALPAIAGQLIAIYQKWRVKAGVTEASGVFNTPRERPPSTQMLSK